MVPEEELYIFTALNVRMMERVAEKGASLRRRAPLLPPVVMHLPAATTPLPLGPPPAPQGRMHRSKSKSRIRLCFRSTPRVRVSDENVTFRKLCFSVFRTKMLKIPRGNS